MRTLLATLAALLPVCGSQVAADDVRYWPIPHRIAKPVPAPPRVNFPGVVSPAIRVNALEWKAPPATRLAVPPLPVRLISAERPVKPVPVLNCPVDLPCPVKVLHGVIRISDSKPPKPQSEPLVTTSIKLQHVSASAAHKKLQAAYATKQSKPVSVPDRVTNTLHIIATKRETDRIRKLIAQADKVVPQYIIQAVIIKIDENGKQKTISRPKFAMLENSLARVQVAAAGNKYIELNVNVRKIKPAKRGVTIFAQPVPRPWRRVAVPVLGGLVKPNPATPIVCPRPAVVTRSSKAIDTPRTVKSVKDGWQIRVVTATRAEPEPLLIKVYSVTDLVKANSKSDVAKSLEALVTVIKSVVALKHVRESGTNCVITGSNANRAIIIRMTKSGHQQVESLLSHLRKLQKAGK